MKLRHMIFSFTLFLSQASEAGIWRNCFCSLLFVFSHLTERLKYVVPGNHQGRWVLLWLMEHTNAILTKHRNALVEGRMTYQVHLEARNRNHGSITVLREY